MSLNVPLLRSSVETVVSLAPDLTSRFYSNLFRMYPETEPLFSPSRRRLQEKMLTDALVAVLDHIEDAPWLVSNLEALGEKHVAYGVRDEMYGWVANAMLATLSEVAGEAWSSELEKAWGDALGAVAGLMLQGAAKARAA